MNPKDGGQNSSDLQRQTAAAIARKKVLAAYTKKAQATTNPTPVSAKPTAPQTVRQATPQTTVKTTPAVSHLKDAPVRQTVDPEVWKKYHSAWQAYYQKYYSDYYSNAARNYVAKERLKDARENAEDEEILHALAHSDPKNKNTGLSLNQNNGNENSDSIRENLRRTIRKKAAVNMKKTRRMRKFIPIMAGIAVVLVILFLQYNRLIFAPIMAYVSPGNVPASQINALDPTINQTVSADPRLIIPKLNVDVPVHFGIPLSEVMSAMNNGVAHYRISGASAFPGEIGNLVITGHSAGDIYSSNPYKYIFSGLERLENGDLIYVNYNSVRYTYKVTKQEVVEPTNTGALIYDTDKPVLTLVTCTPLGTSRYRLLVTAEQISPSTDTAKEAPTDDSTVDHVENAEMPSNEPGFFEGIWNWLTGN